MTISTPRKHYRLLNDFLDRLRPGPISRAMRTCIDPGVWSTLLNGRRAQR